MEHNFFDTDSFDLNDQTGFLLDDHFSKSHQSKRRALDDFFDQRKLQAELDDFDDYT